MPIRLKVLRRKEQQINKVKDLMEMFKVPNPNSNSYYPIGGSSLSSNWSTVTIDPRIQKTKDLFEMYHLVR